MWRSQWVLLLVSWAFLQCVCEEITWSGLGPADVQQRYLNPGGTISLNLKNVAVDSGSWVDCISCPEPTCATYTNVGGFRVYPLGTTTWTLFRANRATSEQ